MSRALIYHALSELLAGSPLWAIDSAREWPLYADASCVAHESPAARRAILSLSEIPAESIDQRQARYDALFNNPPRYWLYESAAKTGRILGPETFAVAKLYHAAGLISSFGAESPDHASLELAFLAHLSEQIESNSEQAEEWRTLERQFIKEHGDWLIQLGRNLSTSGDMIYAPIGQFLTDWLSESFPKQAVTAELASLNNFVPAISHAQDCTLCGFCVQVCPVQALAISESESETMLMLNVQICIGCNKCKKICDTKAITLVPIKNYQLLIIPLRQSPRAICPSCHKATVSRAELEYVGERIGHPAWLDYCLECRPQFYGG
ncbi:MAG: molecular chaperone TorD family protein [Chloroflexi bacterium]|nr:molecular chaperone TorD family protein [Chloroflexota bacterium]